MHLQLEALVDELEAARTRLNRIVEDVPEEVWKRRPGESSWSAAECIAHLNLTSEAYIPILTEALERARNSSGDVPSRYRRDLLGWILWRSSGPKGRMKMNTSAAFTPEAAAPKADLVADFERLQGELIEAVRSADGLPVHRVKIASPFDPRARYSLYSALTILPAHQQRHLAQAERALGGI